MYKFVNSLFSIDHKVINYLFLANSRHLERIGGR